MGQGKTPAIPQIQNSLDEKNMDTSNPTIHDMANVQAWVAVMPAKLYRGQH